MAAYAPPTRDRIPAAIVAVAVQAGLLWALIVGLSVTFGVSADHPLDVFAILPPPPLAATLVEKRPSRSHRPEGAASPPNLRSRAAEIAAPPIVIPAPSPVIAAPAPLMDRAATTGSAEVAGPGTGAGGVGNGLGSGNGGNGDGAGGDETPPRWKSGRIRDSDFPDPLRQTASGGTVGVRYTVLISGRVANCRITHPSGVPMLDQTTCRLITERFRYHPSLDTAGRPVASDIVENHEWVNEMTVEDLVEPPPAQRRRRF